MPYCTAPSPSTSARLKCGRSAAHLRDGGRRQERTHIRIGAPTCSGYGGDGGGGRYLVYGGEGGGIHRIFQCRRYRSLSSEGTLSDAHYPLGGRMFLDIWMSLSYLNVPFLSMYCCLSLYVWSTYNDDHPAGYQSQVLVSSMRRHAGCY